MKWRNTRLLTLYIVGESAASLLSPTERVLVVSWLSPFRAWLISLRARSSLLAVMYTDSLVGLLRMYVFWDWLRFFLQLMLCQWMLNFKQTLVRARCHLSLACVPCVAALFVPRRMLNSE